jgi:hypothetical protein
MLEASQGILLVNSALMPQAQCRHLLGFMHDMESAPRTANPTQTPKVLHTTTVWMYSDVQGMPRQKDTVVETLEAANMSPVTAADLFIRAGDSDLPTSVSIEHVLMLEDEQADDKDAQAAAALELQDHLLKACNLDAPTMCATLAC